MHHGFVAYITSIKLGGWGVIWCCTTHLLKGCGVQRSKGANPPPQKRTHCGLGFPLLGSTPEPYLIAVQRSAVVRVGSEDITKKKQSEERIFIVLSGNMQVLMGRECPTLLWNQTLKLTRSIKSMAEAQCHRKEERKRRRKKKYGREERERWADWGRTV